MSYQKKILTVPTVLTCMRILSIPFLVYLIQINNWRAAFYLFIYAALTDALDGFFARYLNQKTFFGACLDPLADKLLLVSCFYMLSTVRISLFLIPKWFFWVVFFKEFLQIIGVALLHFFKNYSSIEPTILGKITTMQQLTFIGLLLWSHDIGYSLMGIYTLFFVMICISMFFSSIQYIFIGFSIFNNFKKGAFSE